MTTADPAGDCADAITTERREGERAQNGPAKAKYRRVAIIALGGVQRVIPCRPGPIAAQALDFGANSDLS